MTRARKALAHLAALSRGLLRAPTHHIRPQGQLRGHLDGVADDVLSGWVAARGPRDSPVEVGLYALEHGQERLSHRVFANLARDDVRAAGLSTQPCGFAFPEPLLTPGMRYVVRVMDATALEIGRCHYNPTFSGVETLAPSLIAQCQRLFGPELDRPNDVPHSPLSEPDWPLYPPYTALFTSLAGANPPLSAYVAQTRQRLSLERRFDLGNDPDAATHYLAWYLFEYGPGRAPQPAPLSADEISWLNAPIVMGGLSVRLPRVVWWRLLSRPDLMAQFDLNAPGSALRIAFWWAHSEAPALNLSDALVAPELVRSLKSPAPLPGSATMPISYYMTARHAADSRYQALDLRQDDHRAAFAMGLMLEALWRPEVLRYLPSKLVADLQGAPLEAFAAKLRPGAKLTRANYAERLRQKGYCLDRHRFLSQRREGHRLAARMRPTQEFNGVQLIGPMRKASGLGHAARASAQALRAAGVPVHETSFDLDNPAPTYSKTGSDARQSPINLIHLNAETLPLALAYGPDVFAGAYNIGYVFWELDRPVPAQDLGHGILDEIWVASDYAKQSLTGHTETPIHVMGLVQDILDPLPDQTEARAALRRRLDLRDETFVVLAAFDSFSFLQRKNPLGVIAAFQKAFAHETHVALVLKTQNRAAVNDPQQAALWRAVEAHAASDQRIRLLDETLPYQAVLEMMMGSDCYASLHRAEGWGFGMAEAMALGCPVLCTGYSGNMAFTSNETAWLVDYDPVPVQAGEYLFARPDHRWAAPNVSQAADFLRQIHDAPDVRDAKVKAAQAMVRQSLSPEAIGHRYRNRLEQSGRWPAAHPL